MQPLLERAEGVLEDALEFGKKKRATKISEREAAE